MAKLKDTHIYGHLQVDGEIMNKASTTSEGVVKLNNTVTSTSTTEAATANAVKTAYDKANHSHPYASTAVATTSANGLMSSTDKSKLDGIATGANNYTHPSTSGNKHVPSGGSSGQILRWSSDGTAVWGAENNTTYSVATTSANGLMSSTDKAKLDGIATGANNYTHPTTSGNKHIPSGGSAGQILRWSADGTAVWGADNNTTYSVATTSTNGLMSSTDKAKLDGIATGANKTVLNNTVTSTSTTEAATANAVKTAYDKANHSHPYLPTTGGTMTGNIIIKNTYPVLELNQTTNSSIVRFINDAGGYFFVEATAGGSSEPTARMSFSTTDGALYIGNANARVYATDFKPTLADVIDERYVLRSCGDYNDDANKITRTSVYRNTSGTTNFPSTYGNIITFNSAPGAGNYFTQLYSNNSYLGYRMGSDNSMTAGWKQIITSNGGTLSGALNFANNTWNLMGDDAYIGDCNVSGCIGIKGKNGKTGIYFAPYSGSYGQSIYSEGTGTIVTTGQFLAEGALISNNANGLRIAQGNYGFFIRNDGANTYFMLTASGDSYGGYNSLRPMSIANTTGNVHFGHTVGVSGAITLGSSDGNVKRTTISTASPSGGVNGDVWIQY